ncbi:MAG TPA: hypothetical protein PLN19_04110 [Methanothrix sp.]|nr:hypothetical protein [Methanothrix sp.]HOV82300.1 hypothetical protein [Methanothrix sp.]HPC89705.1 hypothetical protein [Methanothrix sp.]HQE87440.1 hypothetical protein [Methanothrix sp.]HQI68938.1 hypothetical protein [Methanothrix sp.]
MKSAARRAQPVSSGKGQDRARKASGGRATRAGARPHAGGRLSRTCRRGRGLMGEEEAVAESDGG